MFRNLFFLLALSFARAEIVEEDDDFIKIKTKHSVLKGLKLLTDNDNYFYSFQTIRYAEPPKGPLRFEPPVKRKSWPEFLDASGDSINCLQSSSFGQETCLFLNVYTPKPQEKKEKGSLPVMAYIYGGGFQIGSSGFQNENPDFFMDNSVVVVTFNYRLNFFGFAALGKSLPANAGLKDQLLALEWVKENIESFGGDPNKVTLFGQDAGAASIGYLLQSKRAKNLFHRVIMQSGSPLAQWAFSNNAVEATKAVGKLFNISYGNDLDKLAEGLKKFDYRWLLQATSRISMHYMHKTAGRSGFVFGPSLESDEENGFLTETPFKAFSEGNFNKVPIIIGYNSFEFFDKRQIGSQLDETLAMFNKNPDLLVPANMNLANKEEELKVGKYIKMHYANPLFKEITQLGYFKFVSDDQLVRPIHKFAEFVSKHTPTYFYEFNYEGGTSGEKNMRMVNGVKHFEELQYLWKNDYALTPKDTLMKDRLIKLWINFANDGVPSLEDEDEGTTITWPKFTNGSFDYLEIGEKIEAKKNPSDSFELWNRLYENFGHPPFVTF